MTMVAGKREGATRWSRKGFGPRMIANEEIIMVEPMNHMEPKRSGAVKT